MTGTGHAALTSGGYLHFGADFQQDVIFLGASGAGTLELSQAFGGTISGFAAFDKIDLDFVAFDAGNHVSWQESNDNTGGALSILDGNNALVASLHLAGVYATGEFSLANDGTGGTVIEGANLARNDLNGDRTSDVLFTSNGAVNAFQVANFAATAWQGVGSYDPAGGDVIAGIGDLNGDGTADVVFYNAASGTVHAFTVNNFQATAYQSVGSVDPAAGYSVAAIGDLNGDGTADMLFQNGGSLNAFEVQNYAATDWQAVGSFDPTRAIKSSASATSTATAPRTCCSSIRPPARSTHFRSTISRPPPGKASAASIPMPAFRSPALPISTATAPMTFCSYNPSNGALNAFEVHNFTATAMAGRRQHRSRGRQCHRRHRRLQRRRHRRCFVLRSVHRRRARLRGAQFHRHAMARRRRRLSEWHVV